MELALETLHLLLLKDSVFIVFRISVLSLLLLKDSNTLESFIVFLILVLSLLLLLLFFFFPDTRLETQISETAQHSATKLHSYMDPYPTMCIKPFWCRSKLLFWI